ncbi:MAG: hypothetical protein NUW00_01340 [Candidatus Kaiserbacteria bacterium]|nr:hypothetical protein [Candidatus Kaiserbacteria bacterium]
MAYDPRSSFGQAPGVVPAYVRKQRTIQVYRVLAGIMSTCAVVASVGVFVYKSLSMNELEAAKAELEAVSAEDTGNQKKISELQAYDLKLATARKLLDGHLAPSRIFEELERSTKETVAFKKFEYSYEPGFDVILTLIGNTKELDSVFLQKQQFFKDGLFSEFIVQDVTLLEDTEAEEGQVVISSGIDFSVEGLFDKKTIVYQGEVVSDGVGAVEEAQQATSTDVVASMTNGTTTATSTPVESNEVTP